ncbi:hypothetical protein FB567DRAFT_214885 [Paraphoma chrysanthemicola]|uniref:Uncharacterized protein n=1 Tax=Paraphoma chrysanthemicola TaxID=798071 RepID=A0A8K0VT53_9PLEO|nr:hypothetical protein FB567DRAFT_214885 [Paraphoma chrysanthemicola]
MTSWTGIIAFAGASSRVYVPPSNAPPSDHCGLRLSHCAQLTSATAGRKSEPRHRIRRDETHQLLETRISTRTRRRHQHERNALWQHEDFRRRLNEWVSAQLAARGNSFRHSSFPTLHSMAATRAPASVPRHGPRKTSTSIQAWPARIELVEEAGADATHISVRIHWEGGCRCEANQIASVLRSAPLPRLRLPGTAHDSRQIQKGRKCTWPVRALPSMRDSKHGGHM